MAAAIDGGEDYFCIDSKPIEVCRPARAKRCSMGKNEIEKTPSFGYCASQGVYYYGYKLHAVCGLSGVIFETAHIRLEVPYRSNQKDWKPTFAYFAKARKRIETLFSQLCDQFMIERNYAKDIEGLFTRIISKISALTILQYINCKNQRLIGRIKYVLI